MHVYMKLYHMNSKVNTYIQYIHAYITCTHIYSTYIQCIHTVHIVHIEYIYLKFITRCMTGPTIERSPEWKNFKHVSIFRAMTRTCSYRTDRFISAWARLGLSSQSSWSSADNRPSWSCCRTLTNAYFRFTHTYMHTSLNSNFHNNIYTYIHTYIIIYTNNLEVNLRRSLPDSLRTRSIAKIRPQKNCTFPISRPLLDLRNTYIHTYIHTHIVVCKNNTYIHTVGPEYTHTLSHTHTHTHTLTHTKINTQIHIHRYIHEFNLNTIFINNSIFTWGCMYGVQGGSDTIQHRSAYVK